MAPTPSPTAIREQAARYSDAQRRTIDAALALFAEHGVGGTSLQMIADALGVTKAAVYHQFRTKDAIVLAVLEVNLQDIEAALEAAEADHGSRARERLLERVVEATVRQRTAISTLQSDPVLARLLGAHEPSRQLWSRVYAALLGHELDAPTRVRAAALSAAIGSVGHPFVAEVDDETLRTELLASTRRLLPRRS